MKVTLRGQLPPDDPIFSRMIFVFKNAPAPEPEEAEQDVSEPEHED